MHYEFMVFKIVGFKYMFSGKKFIRVFSVCFFTAGLAYFLALLGYDWAVYIAAPAIIIGATTCIFGSVLAMIGKLKNDFKE